MTRAAGVFVAAAMASVAVAGPATRIIAEAPSIAAECDYLLRECALARALIASRPAWVEHPSGVVLRRTDPEAALHAGNAVEAAAAMRHKHGTAPACVRQCDELLRR